MATRAEEWAFQTLAESWIGKVESGEHDWSSIGHDMFDHEVLGFDESERQYLTDPNDTKPLVYIDDRDDPSLVILWDGDLMASVDFDAAYLDD